MIERKKRNMVVSFSNYKDMILHLQKIEPPYNPTNKLLLLEELESMSQEVETTIASLSVISAEYKLQSKKRLHLFSSVDSKVRRIINELKALGITSDEINSIKSMKMRIEGKRIGELPEEINRGSLAGSGYRKKLGYLRDVISLLRTIENYKPSSADLSMTALNEFYDSLVNIQRLNTELHLQILSLINKRNQLYNQEYGLADLSHKVKQYFLSIEGHTGFNYKVLCKFPVSKIRVNKTTYTSIKEQLEPETLSHFSMDTLEGETTSEPVTEN